MPFQSDKQKRWMYANEPEIAREWSDRYGAMNGGIMDVASDGNTRHDFANFTNGNNINVPTSFQARPQSQPVNLAYITPQEQGILQTLKPGTPHEGPMGIPNYDSFDAAGGYSNPGTGYSASSGGGGGGWQDSSRADAKKNEMAEQVRRNYVNKENIKSSPLHKKYNPNWKMGGAKSGFGGNILRAIMSMFGGIPGKALSLLSHINPGKLRGWNEEEGRYNTQDEWESARTNRRNQKRLDNMYKRKSLGKGYSQKNIDMIEAMGLKPSTAQNVDSGRGSNLRGKELTKQLSTQMPSQAWDNFASPTGTHYPGSYDENDYYTGTLSFEDQVARNKAKLESLGFTEATDENLDPGWSAHRNMTHANAPQSIKDFYTNSFRSRYDDQGLASLNNQWSGPQIQQVKVTDAQKSMIDSAVKNYNLADSDFKNNPTLQKEVFDEAKKHDDKGSEGWGFGWGKRDPEPMTRQEYRDYLVSKGYI